MKVFTCDDHEGYWPVGTASIVVAENEEEAHKILYEKLKSINLVDNDFTLKELDTSKPNVVVLRDGDY